MCTAYEWMDGWSNAHPLKPQPPACMSHRLADHLSQSPRPQHDLAFHQPCAKHGAAWSRGPCYLLLLVVVRPPLLLLLVCTSRDMRPTPSGALFQHLLPTGMCAVHAHTLTPTRRNPRKKETPRQQTQNGACCLPCLPARCHPAAFLRIMCM